MKRREFLVSASTLALAPKFSFAKSGDRLRAEIVQMPLIGTGEMTELWGFNGASPGPILRAKKGEPFRVTFENQLAQPTAIHWHGLRIENAMDGVPDLTQAPVAQGERFDYEFTPPDAGSFWYHSHLNSLEQVARGLYGVLIVEEDNPPEVDHDLVVVLDDWRISRDGVLQEGFENNMDISHGGRLGNFARALIPDLPEQLRKGERVRWRLLNAATDRIFPIQIRGVEGKTVAFDGMPVKAPQPLEAVELAPGQRVDIIADIFGDIELILDDANGEYLLASLPIAGEIERKREEIEALPLNDVPAPSFRDIQEASLILQGGMMAAAPASGEIWAINDQSRMEDAALLSASNGQSVRFQLVNQTRFPHVIHFHGHHFAEEKALGLGPLRDGFLVEAGAEISVVGVLDNPGKWMVHCHMLAHQKGGMLGWFEVT